MTIGYSLCRKPRFHWIRPYRSPFALQGDQPPLKCLISAAYTQRGDLSRHPNEFLHDCVVSPSPFFSLLPDSWFCRTVSACRAVYPPFASSGTAFTAAVDSHGNACALLSSNMARFGCAVVQEYGFAVQVSYHVKELHDIALFASNSLEIPSQSA